MIFSPSEVGDGSLFKLYSTDQNNLMFVESTSSTHVESPRIVKITLFRASEKNYFVQNYDIY